MNRRAYRRLIVLGAALAPIVLLAAKPVLAQATVTLLDTNGSVGHNPAIAIGADGLGLIAYYDLTNGDLKVAHCQNVACTSAAISTIDSADNVGLDAAIAIGADGLGIISYFGDPGVLKAAHCDDIGCTSATVTVVDPTIYLQGQPSVAIGSDGLPIIAYVRGPGFEAQLVSAHCSNAACSASTLSILKTVAGAENMDTAMAIGADGLGLIAYPSQYIFPGSGASISMAHCVDIACTAVTPSGPEPPRIDVPQGGATRLERPSLLIGSDGRGLVSYRRILSQGSTGTQYEIVVQHCAGIACESFDSTRLFPMADLDGPNAPLAMGEAGLPRLVRAQNFRLRIAQCADPSCTASTDSCVFASGRDTSMARGTDGQPLVAFQALAGFNLGVAHGSESCTAVASIQDLAVDEGDMFLPIQVSLNTSTDQTATVAFQTADITAQAGSDYEPVSGMLTFEPGQAFNVIFVLVHGDSQYEADETFQVVLSDPQGLVIGDGVGVVTLRDDDGPPTVSPGECSVTEGDSGSVRCLLDARLSHTSSFPVTIDYATANGTAQAGVDFLAASGTLSFPPGMTVQSTSVSVVGDTAVELDETFFVNLSNPVNAVIDAQGEGLIVDDDAPSLSSLELTHGARVNADLAAAPGPLADQDVYRLGQGAYSSWEVVVDDVSGDVAPGLLLERLAEDNSTVLQTGTPVGTGSARAIRWQRRAATPEVRQHIRVRSMACTTNCGADDTYRLRVYETTGAIARFNNSGSQVAVLILQNATNQPIQAVADFWGVGGGLLATMTVPLGPNAVGVVNTATLPALIGTAGSVTVTHDGPHGALAGKAVSLEPTTGFSFDSPMVYKPR